MKLGKLYREEVKKWRLNEEQRGLLIAFLFCLELRSAGIEFETHFSSGGMSPRMEAACASE
ncbi:MAG: hypothetical protein V4773_27605 [Verrucomicrobiota bacterium]